MKELELIRDWKGKSLLSLFLRVKMDVFRN